MPIGLLAKYVRLTTLMETYGPNIGMPHTKPLGKGLIDMRLKAVEGVARIFYAALIGREIVILHSLIKKTDKIPKKDLEVAYNRLQEIKK